MFDDLQNYLKERYSVGCQMMRLCSGNSRDLVVSSMPSDTECDTRGSAERRWAAIYLSSDNTAMYRHILDMMPPAAGCTVLEHGCSVGVMSRLLKDSGASVTGVDMSFPALHMAARQRNGIQYVAADSASLSCSKFDVVMALNMLELIEPRTLLDAMTQKATQFVVVADPYDYMRGSRSVSNPVYGVGIRHMLSTMGFEVTSKTRTPAYIPWNLRISSRTTIRYLVDLIIAKRV